MAAVRALPAESKDPAARGARGGALIDADDAWLDGEIASGRLTPALSAAELAAVAGVLRDLPSTKTKTTTRYQSDGRRGGHIPGHQSPA